jgi:predicted DNA-binding protein
MRSVLSISVPPDVKKQIQQKAKKAGKTVSEYLIRIFKREESLISEDDLLEIAERARKQHKEGKTKRLRSLEDLM